MDAFAFPKSSLIIAGGIWLLFANLKIKKNIKFDYLGFLLLLFSAWLVTLIFTSDYAWISLFGVNGRATGILLYLSLTVLMWRGAKFTLQNQIKLFKTFLWVGGFVLIYGLIQFLKLDPFDWNLIYNGIIGFFGNPNFMGAFSALVGIAAFSLTLDSKKPAKSRILGIALLSLSVIDIYASRAFQGLISLLIGVAPLIIYLGFKRSKLLGVSSVLLSLVGLLTFTLGLFRLGPLADLVYKQSVSYRGDFWRTAINMIRENPIFGVGFERFGVNYRSYRDVPQVLRNGVDAYSDNAHNLYLHFAATGGLFLALIFLSIDILILLRMISRIRKVDENLYFYLTIFSIWLAVQAQSLISVDTPAITFWSWLFAGFICGSQVSSSEKKGDVSLQKILAGVLVMGYGVLFILQSNSQISVNTAFYIQIPKKDQKYANAKAEILLKAESHEPLNAEWPILSANSLIQDEAYPQTIEAAKRAINLDPKDYRAWFFLASAQEEMGDFEAAVTSRNKAAEIDPYNSSNLLELGRDLKKLGKLLEARKIIDEITKFAPESKDLDLAVQELK